MSQTSSTLDRDDIAEAVAEWVREGETNAGIVLLIKERFGVTTSEGSLRRFRKRHHLRVPGQTSAYTKIAGADAEAQTEAVTEQILDDPDTMLRERGMNPEEWIITNVSPNEYQGPNSSEAVAAGAPAKITYYQTKFSAKRKVTSEDIFPRTDGWIAPKAVPRQAGNPQLTVVVGDQQAPFQDKALHRLFCEWLRVNQPGSGISLGDGVDFPDIRPGHRFDPDNNATPKECLQALYDIFKGYRTASPHTLWQKLIGNHDERIRNILLDLAPVRPLYGISRPIDEDGSGGEELLGLSHAARLDELGVEVIDPKGQYDLAQINLTNKLAVKHGWIARKGSGTSALATLEHLGYSIIVGHTHRQSVVHHTKHEIDGQLRVLTGVEAGCMCRVDQTPDPDDGRKWPGYAVAPDWQQGFVTVEVWPDGYFNIDTAKYVNGVLMWRDQRYTI